MVITELFCAFKPDKQIVTKLTTMITKDKVTEIFCVIDEFDKNSDLELKKNLLPVTDGRQHRNRKASLSDSEIMTILLLFHFGAYRNFKHYSSIVFVDT